jgi:hypothetical protein
VAVLLDTFAQQAVQELDLFAKASRFFVLLGNLRLKFFRFVQLNVETLPDLGELVFDDREGSNRTLRTCLPCFTRLSPAVHASASGRAFSAQ